MFAPASIEGRLPRPHPVATGLLLAFSVHATAGAALGESAWSAFERNGQGPLAQADAFARLLRARWGESDSTPPATATTRTVGNCNDSGSGSLRAAFAAAVSGDTISMTGLACSTITLTSGALTSSAANLTIVGRGQQLLTIGANNQSGVFIHTGTGTLSVSDLTLTKGSYALGGCIATLGNLSLARATVTACTATGYSANQLTAGGGAFVKGNLAMASSTLSANAATDASNSGDKAFGGGAIVLGNATVGSSAVRSNTAVAGGALAGGGGLYVIGTLDVTTSTFDNNTALDIGGPYSSGGGVFVAGVATISSSTVSNNNSATGGGIAEGTTATLTVSNSTISGNDAGIIGGGIIANGAVHLYNSTVALNYAGAGAEHGTGTTGIGAGVVIGASSVLQSSIVAGNNARNNANAADFAIAPNHTAALSGANNLVRYIDTGVTLPSGTLRVDPKLALALGSNGGPSQTLALNGGSPAIDAGNNAKNLQTDQRGTGYCRVAGAHADIGAFEVQSSAGCDRIFKNGFDP